MKKILSSAISLAFALSLSNAHAAEQISKRNITNLQVYTPYAVVQLATPSENLDGCTSSSAESYVAINFDNTAGKELYAAVLAARLNNQLVGFGVSGCRNWGEVTVPLVYRVDL